jgi:sigma-B regulation protein RsbU (phosphoserine phosphatase)
LGLLPEAEHTIARTKLEPGETLVLFSDGVTEAADRSDELFGVPRLQEMLTEHFESPLDSIQDAIVKAVERFSVGAAQADDLTLLLVRYSGNAQDAVLPLSADILGQVPQGQI